jgi:hypothetical protein
MDPKLIRMYSDILNEQQDFATQYAMRNAPTPVRSGQGAVPATQPAAAPTAPNTQVRGARGGAGQVVAPGAPKPLPGNPNAPAYQKDPGQNKKVGTGASGFPVQSKTGAGGLPSKKPPVDAMKGSQATAAQTQTSSYGGQDTRTANARDPNAAPPTQGFAGGTTPAAPAAAAPSGPAAGTTAALDQAKAGIAAGGVPAAAPTPDYDPETDPSLAAGRAELAKAEPVNVAASSKAGGYAQSATGAEGQGGSQAAMPASGVPVTGGFGQSTNLVSRTPDQIAADNKKPLGGMAMEEDLEEELAEMMRLSGLALNEKAVSKQQQKFMGMVHAMQKGEKVKGASPELKKAAKGMSKSDARDFAKTKHKGLPQKVNEGIHLMLDEDGHTLEHIVNRYKHEVRRFIEGDFMPENLYDALYDYYMDRGDMPYGVAKAREGDPYQWVSERFYDDVMRDLGNGMNETAQPVMDDTLNELAHLAGLTESKLDECGDMGMDQRDTINVSTNMSSDGNKSVNISAQGEKAEELLAMLKLAGMGDKPRFNTDDGVDLDHPGAIEIHGTMDADGAEQLAKQLRHASMSEQEMMDEAKKTRATKYKNTPDEEYQSVASITRQGNDLNREKRQYADKPKLGDNPMAEGISLEEQFEELYNSVLVKEADPKRPKGDTGQAEIYTADLGIQPPSPDEGPVGKAPVAPKQPAAPKAPVAVPGTKR